MKIQQVLSKLEPHVDSDFKKIDSSTNYILFQDKAGNYLRLTYLEANKEPKKLKK